LLSSQGYERMHLSGPGGYENSLALAIRMTVCRPVFHVPGNLVNNILLTTESLLVRKPNGCLVMRRVLIVDSKVVRGIPSFRAAPDAPDGSDPLAKRVAACDLQEAIAYMRRSHSGLHVLWVALGRLRTGILTVFRSRNLRAFLYTLPASLVNLRSKRPMGTPLLTEGV